MQNKEFPYIWRCTLMVFIIVNYAESKSGTCPQPSSHGYALCTQQCSQDEDCPGHYKCCENSCGANSCQPPADATPEKPGFCPHITSPIIATKTEDQCRRDNCHFLDLKCPGIQKCCPDVHCFFQNLKDYNFYSCQEPLSFQQRVPTLSPAHPDLPIQHRGSSQGDDGGDARPNCKTCKMFGGRCKREDDETICSCSMEDVCTRKRKFNVTEVGLCEDLPDGSSGEQFNSECDVAIRVCQRKMRFPYSSCKSHESVVPIIKPGNCPIRQINIGCKSGDGIDIECQSDQQCAGERKCCNSACGLQCSDPVQINYSPQDRDRGGGDGKGVKISVILPITILSVFVMALSLAGCCWYHRYRKKESSRQINENLSQQSASSQIGDSWTNSSVTLLPYPQDTVGYELPNKPATLRRLPSLPKSEGYYSTTSEYESIPIYRGYPRGMSARNYNIPGYMEVRTDGRPGKISNLYETQESLSPPPYPAPPYAPLAKTGQTARYDALHVSKDTSSAPADDNTGGNTYTRLQPSAPPAPDKENVDKSVQDQKNVALQRESVTETDTSEYARVYHTLEPPKQ